MASVYESFPIKLVLDILLAERTTKDELVQILMQEMLQHYVKPDGEITKELLIKAMKEVDRNMKALQRVRALAKDAVNFQHDHSSKDQVLSSDKILEEETTT